MNDDGDGAIMNENGMEARFNAAREIARDAGRLALKHFLLRDTLKVETKGVHDLVSEADRDVEALISSRLMALFPDDGFIGEETGVKAGGGEGSRDLGGRPDRWHRQFP
jgi:myo-inositol-1(or 4)-monophosphatase